MEKIFKVYYYNPDSFSKAIMNDVVTARSKADARKKANPTNSYTKKIVSVVEQKNA